MTPRRAYRLAGCEYYSKIRGGFAARSESGKKEVSHPENLRLRCGRNCARFTRLPILRAVCGGLGSARPTTAADWGQPALPPRRAGDMNVTGVRGAPALPTRSRGMRDPLMGTIVKGQSRAILPLRFPRYLGSSVHRRLSADAIRLQKVSSVFLLFAIRSLRRASIV